MYIKKDKKHSKYKKEEKLYECECGKQFEKSQGLNAHFSWCLIHRNGVLPINKRSQGNMGKGSWSKGLTKDTDDRIKNMALKVSIKLKNHITSDETKNKISSSLKGKNKIGGYHDGCNRWKGEYIKFNEEIIWLDSSWEKLFVEKCIINNIKWTKNNKIWFNYTHNDNTYKYYPDFFLSDYNLWIEIKGMIKEKDYSKWNQFPNNLQILKSKKEISNFFDSINNT
jgi:hypothetical protein